MLNSFLRLLLLNKQLAIMKVNAKPLHNSGFMKLMLSVLAFSFFTAVQAQTVSGTVSDENGKSLQGVSVVVKGAAGGTTTDVGVSIP